MKLAHLFFVVSTLVFSHSALALRCDNKVVGKGDSLYKFYKLCGEPDFVQKRVVYKALVVSEKLAELADYHTHDQRQDDRVSNQAHFSRVNQTHYHVDDRGHEIQQIEEQQLQIEIWTYDFGTNQLVQEIRFVDGIADKISDRGYGFTSN